MPVTDADTERELTQRPFEDAAEQTPRAGAQREANADLTRPLRHRERHQRVYPRR